MFVEDDSIVNIFGSGMGTSADPAMAVLEEML